MGREERLAKRKGERKVKNILKKLSKKEHRMCRTCGKEIPKSQHKVFCLTNASLEFFYFFCSNECTNKFKALNNINVNKP
jgi:RNA polymerase-binding transcription factor DksA